MERARRAILRIVDLLAGVRCAGCGASTTAVVCEACVVEACRMPPAPDAAFRDHGAVGRIVRAAKRGDLRSGGRVLAQLVMATRAGLVPPCDVVTWVPADRGRRAVRGGHLPERFARSLADLLGVPAVELLRAEQRRRSQRGLGRLERRQNVAGAFAPTAAGHGLSRAAARVLVVDDVRTTGATLDATRAALEGITLHVRVMAIVGVEEDRAAPPDGAVPLRCRNCRSERGKVAHDSNDLCRCHPARPSKGCSLTAPRPP